MGHILTIFNLEWDTSWQFSILNRKHHDNFQPWIGNIMTNFSLEWNSSWQFSIWDRSWQFSILNGTHHDSFLSWMGHIRLIFNLKWDTSWQFSILNGTYLDNLLSWKGHHFLPLTLGLIFNGKIFLQIHKLFSVVFCSPDCRDKSGVHKFTCTTGVHDIRYL